MTDTETIIAQITPQGKSGVAILRISGKQATTVCMTLLKKIPKPRYAYYSNFFDTNNNILDQVISIWFPLPHSFTGEDVLEIQCHGNPILINLIIKTILTIPNIRIAEPGEFSKRAFLNNKMDLLQAEAIADIINSDSEQSLKAALNSMQGHFSKYIKKFLKKIIYIRVTIESSINFEEINDLYINEILNKKLPQLIFSIKEIIKIASQGSILREGIKIAIIGEPNVGKSSLFNALALKNAAIVTNIKGTTRDILREYINVSGYTFCFSDTAGLHNTINEIEKIGIQKTWNEVKKSDYILVLSDVSQKDNLQYKNICKKIPSKIPFTVIFNKCDLIGKTAQLKTVKKINYIYLSAKKRLGIDLLYQFLIKQCIHNNNNLFQSEGIFLARNRHLFYLKKCLLELIKGNNIWKKLKNIELLAEHINQAQIYLNTITGAFSSEDLLDNIFSNFCIGK